MFWGHSVEVCIHGNVFSQFAGLIWGFLLIPILLRVSSNFDFIAHCSSSGIYRLKRRGVTTDPCSFELPSVSRCVTRDYCKILAHILPCWVENFLFNHYLLAGYYLGVLKFQFAWCQWRSDSDRYLCMLCAQLIRNSGFILSYLGMTFVRVGQISFPGK